MYKIHICEENRILRDSLERLIRCYFLAKRITVSVRCFEKSESLLQYPEYADIVFLGIDNVKGLRIDTVRQLQSKNPNMYLYILSDKYNHLDVAMDLKAFRYLSYNFDIHRIIASLDIITKPQNTISFMSNYMMVELKETEIVCIFSKDRKTIVLTDSGELYPTTLAIKNWLGRLSDSEDFMQPHYSYIVNKNCIHSFDGKVITLRYKDGKTMKVYPSQRRMVQVKNALAQTALR